MALPTASDNPFPSVLIVEGTTPSSPSAGNQRLFVRSSDHLLCVVNSSGTVTPLATAGFANPMTTAGDIIYGGASGLPTRRAIGAATTVLHGGASAPAYSAVVEADLGLTDVTTADATTSQHGFLKKLDNNAAHFMDGTGAWSTPSGGSAALLAVNKYAPSSQTIYTVSGGTTYADVDSTNMKVTFTAPASGNVIVRLSAMADATTNDLCWALRESTTDLEGGRVLRTTANGSVVVFDIYLTGISAGSHTYKWSFAASASGGSQRIIVQDGIGATHWPAALMQVWSAP